MEKINNRKSLTIKYIGYLLFIAVLTAFDQLTKFVAVDKLKGHKAFVIWDGVFELTYVENRGAAFGMQEGKIAMFVIITAILVPVLIYAIYRIDNILKEKGTSVSKRAFTLLQIDLVLLIAGAIGNLIDRLANGYVVDFFYFKLIDFPVFNVADCYVTVSTIALMLICCFMLSEKELDYLLRSKKKWEDTDEDK